MTNGSSRGRKWGVIAVAGLVGVFYVWTLVSSKRSWRWGEPQRDYYNLLVDGFLAGQLNLKTEVSPELLRLKDPYDPELRPPGVGLHDASFYRGKYYIYFGVVPAVVLLLPFSLVTGLDLPLPAAVGLFVLGGFVLSVAGWRDMRRRYFPRVTAGTDVVCVLALGVASMGPVLLRRPTVYELAIASAYFFAMGGLWCIGKSLHATRRKAGWIAGVSLCMGLAVGSRPSYVVAAPLAMVPLAWWWWRIGCGEVNIPGRRREWLRGVVAGAVPLAACGALLALYNYQRFGSVAEFGVRYILSGVYESRMTHFSFSYFAYNFRNYFFAMPEWVGWFPFVRATPWPSGPVGTVLGDGYFGVLTTLPLIWLAAVAVAAVGWRNRAEEAGLRVWVASGLAVGGGTAVLLSGFYASAARYQVDFVPALILLGCVGVAALEEALMDRGRPWLRHLGRTGLWGIAVYSAGISALVSIQSNNELRERNLAHYHEVARWFNHLPAWIEKMRGVRYGPVEIEVLLKSGEESVVSTLLSGAGEGRPWRVFINQEKGQRVQVGFEQANGPTRLSRWFAAEGAKPHLLRIDLGQFYPPREHPEYVRWRGTSAVAPERRLRVEWDGAGVIEDRGNFPKGEVMASARIATERGLSAEGGAERERVRLRLFLLPNNVRKEVELVNFSPGLGGGHLFSRFTDENRICFGARTSSGLIGECEPIALERAGVHEVEFALWHEADQSSAREPQTCRVECKLDGVIVGAFKLPEGIASGGFADQANVPTEGAGTIYSRERFAAGRDPLLARHGAVRLRVEWPNDRNGQREPLVSTGAAGRGDFMCVEYVDEKHVRFAFDSWGRAMVQSELVPIDFRASHEVEVGFGSLMVGPDMSPIEVAKEKKVTVSVDGRRVWSTYAEYHPAEADEVFFAENPIGGTSCSAKFTGQILGVMRLKKPDFVR